MKIFYLSLIFSLSISHETFSQNVLNTKNKLYAANHSGSVDYLAQPLNNNNNDGLCALKEMNAFMQKSKVNSLSARAPVKYLLDSAYRNSTDNNGISYDTFYKSIYSYYPNGNTEEFFSYRYSNGIWINNYKTNYFLNSQKLDAGYVSQLWVNPGLWENNQKLERNYNPNGQILVSIYSDWNKTTMAWVYNFRYTSSYNIDNQLIEIVYESYDPISQKWDITIKWNYYYDSNGLISEFLRQSFKNNVWENESKYLATYNTKKLLIEENYFDWNVNENKYVQSEKATYTYNSFDLVEESIYYYWDASLMIFIEEYKEQYTYDLNNNPKERYDYEENEDSAKIVLYQKYDYYYSLHDVATKTTNNASNIIEIYPNPFQNVIHLNNLSQDSNMTIVDINGKIIFHAVNENILDLTALNSGVYFLEIVSDRERSMHKIVKN